MLDDGDAVLFGIGGILTDLAFDGFFALVVAGIAGVDHGSHGRHLPFRYCCATDAKQQLFRIIYTMNFTYFQAL